MITSISISLPRKQYNLDELDKEIRFYKGVKLLPIVCLQEKCEKIF